MLALAAVICQPPAAFGQGTAFSYQGSLYVNGAGANGSYDLEFTVFDAVTNGDLIAGPLTNTATSVSNGLFTATMDFGDVFNGSKYWLQIDVRTNGSDGFTALNPRQALAPIPYAIYAGAAGSATTLNGLVPGGDLSGTYSNALAMTNTANEFDGSFAGNGSGLSNLTAGNLNGVIPPSSLGLDLNTFITNGSGQIVLPNADLSVNLGNLPNLKKALSANAQPRFLWFGDSTGVYFLPTFQTFLQNYTADHGIQLSGSFWDANLWGPAGNQLFETDPTYYWQDTRAISAGTNITCGGPAAQAQVQYVPGNQIQIWMEGSASNGVANLSCSPDFINWTILGTLDESALGVEGKLVVTNFSVPFGNYAIQLQCLSGTFRWIGDIGVIQTNSTTPLFYDMHAPGETLQNWTNMGSNIAVILSNVNPTVTFYEQTKLLSSYNDYTNFAWWMSNYAPNSDVVLISSYQDPTDPPAGNGPASGDNFARTLFIRNVALTNHWPMVDVWTPMGTWSNIVAQGFNLDSIVHLNAQGQDFLGQIVLEKLNLPSLWQAAGQASIPLNFSGDFTITPTGAPTSGIQFAEDGPYTQVLCLNAAGGDPSDQWSLGAWTGDGGVLTLLRGSQGIQFQSSTGTYGFMRPDGGWSMLDWVNDPHGGVDPAGPGVILANTTTNYNLSFAGNGFASGATIVTSGITATTWVNTNPVNGSIWVSTATNLTFFNSAGMLVFGPVSVTNAAFPVGPGWEVTNSAATFNFGAF